MKTLIKSMLVFFVLLVQGAVFASSPCTKYESFFVRLGFPEQDFNKPVKSVRAFVGLEIAEFNAAHTLDQTYLMDTHWVDLSFNKEESLFYGMAALSGFAWGTSGPHTEIRGPVVTLILTYYDDTVFVTEKIPVAIGLELERINLDEAGIKALNKSITAFLYDDAHPESGAVRVLDRLSC